jgi:hypothetical protein
MSMRTGFDDLIVGAVHDSRSGAAYVVFGRSGGFLQEVNVSTLDGNNGFKMTDGREDLVGVSVSAAGDVNGDGLGISSSAHPDPNPFPT